MFVFILRNETTDNETDAIKKSGTESDDEKLGTNAKSRLKENFCFVFIILNFILIFKTMMPKQKVQRREAELNP